MFSIHRLAMLFSLPAAVAACLITPLGCASTSEPAADAQAAASTPAQAAGGAETREQSASSLVAVKLEPVYFETDRADLRPEAREVLARSARSILDHPEWGVIRIEGHCDERGSDAYNLQLGMERAAAVERQLVKLGVPRARLATESRGARQPAVVGHSEAAWRFNRRSEVRVDERIASATR